MILEVAALGVAALEAEVQGTTDPAILAQTTVVAAPLEAQTELREALPSVRLPETKAPAVAAPPVTLAAEIPPKTGAPVVDLPATAVLEAGFRSPRSPNRRT